MALTKEEKRRRYCPGCFNDFYNGEGAEECWSLARAKVVWRKEVHVDQKPPFKQKAKRVLNCYRRPNFFYLDPKQEY